MKKILLPFIIILVFCAAAHAQTREIRLSTYYPAPFGNYDRLRLVPRDMPASCQDGLMIYHDNNPAVSGRTEGFYFCDGGVWREAGENIWSLDRDAEQIYTSNDFASPKVGIGVSGPVNPLDVSGGAVIGSGYVGAQLAPADGMLVEGNMAIGTATPSFTNGARLYIDAAASTDYPIQTRFGGVFLQIGPQGILARGTSFNIRSQEGDILFHTGNPLTQRMEIDNATGNVGIGTAATGTERLNVNGNLSANGNLSVSGDIGWGTAGAGLTTNQGASIELRGTGWPFIDFSNDSSTDYDMRLILMGDDDLQIRGGNVGIGNNTPSHRLDVEGSVNIDGALNLNTNTSGNNGELQVNCNAGPCYSYAVYAP